MAVLVDPPQRDSAGEGPPDDMPARVVTTASAPVTEVGEPKLA